MAGQVVIEAEGAQLIGFFDSSFLAPDGSLGGDLDVKLGGGDDVLDIGSSDFGAVSYEGGGNTDIFTDDGDNVLDSLELKSVEITN